MLAVYSSSSIINNTFPKIGILLSLKLLLAFYNFVTMDTIFLFILVNIIILIWFQKCEEKVWKCIFRSDLKNGLKMFSSSGNTKYSDYVD